MNKLGSVSVGGKNPIRIMGILNFSPESFHKKSIVEKPSEIKRLVKKMEDEGADFLDIGGMSTAPYLTTMVSEKTEKNRIEKAIKIIQKISNLPISIDTCRANVAKTALELGVEIINDISGLKYDPSMKTILEKYHPSLVVCAFSSKPVSGNNIKITKNLLAQSLKLARSANISSRNIVVDPAIGFFRKTGNGKFFTRINSDWIERDLDVIRNLKKISRTHPVLVSISNKSFIGKILSKEKTSDRIYGSIAAEVISVINGASIIRTHNVAETRDAITIAQKIAQKKPRKAYNTS